MAGESKMAEMVDTKLELKAILTYTKGSRDLHVRLLEDSLAGLGNSHRQVATQLALVSSWGHAMTPALLMRTSSLRPESRYAELC